ncbi:MAG TPA: hypothetical protein VM779_06825 [Thermoanaerobaculia bacterium]|nr:hypothetical protein [Thermoanaerobaculia bacterium]
MSVLLGRLLQLIGLLLLPLGLMIGLFHDNIGLEVRLLFIGGLLFTIGWMLARRTE